MKNITIFTVVLAMLTIFVGSAYAHRGEGAAAVEKGERYEMMVPGDRHMQDGDHMMYPSRVLKGSDECRFGWWGATSGHHYGWMFGYGLFKLVFAGLFFWFLFRIVKALEILAAAKQKE
jgi:hypothetical protein